MKNLKKICVFVFFSIFTKIGTAEQLNLIDKNAFPNTPKIDEWFNEVETFNFDLAEYTFVLGGSTSCNAHIYLNGEKIGKFVPENPAGNPNTETAYFNFGRMVKQIDAFQRAASLVLGQVGTKKFQEMILNGKVGNAQRANCDFLKAKTTKINFLEGSYKDKVSGEEIDLKDYYTSTGLNLNKKVSRFLKQGNTKPTDALMSIDSKMVPTQFQAREKDLAEQLFNILVADVLFSQYDRYSGDNFVVRLEKNTKVSFFAKDNGGTYLIPGYTTKNYKALKENWFDRYDRETMETLEDLQTFLNSKDGSVNFMGFNNRLAFASALGLKFTRTNGRDAPTTSVENQLRHFTANLNKLMQKYKEDLRRGGEDAYL